MLSTANNKSPNNRISLLGDFCSAKIAEGTFDKVKEDPAVIRAYLGRGGR